ncbi:kinase-like domain-containing protein [Choanephora cucurbitarum]|nr:kinase-like domain-containing protein [Choanephora cucurbitarum]
MPTIASYTPHKLTVLTTPLDENPPVFESATPDSTKRYQTKMLLASLIEHFCSAYGDTPDANRKVFFLICQTLRSLGMMDAEFMDEMTSVRSAFQQAFHKLFYTAVQTVRNQDLLEFDKMQPNEFLNLNVQNSRYNTDFVELNLLGKGGFASAYRARNKLDGIDYAIKKIRLGNDIEAEEQKKSDDNPYERIFREIKNLARLEHQNVVRYYSSWLEFDESPIRSDEKNSEDDFEEDDYEDESDSKSSGGWTLFIQMQLCPTTLHDYIRLRNKQYAQDTASLDPLVETKRNLEIFYQILQGTAYIHEQGLIHRDLKPSNIFLYTTDKHKRHQPTSWVPKIGDFGLAAEAMDDEGTGESVLVPTPISSTPPSPQIGPVSDHTSSRRRPKPVRTRTMGVGTRTYASPEQLAAQIYDEKVDIYSLGIILFELFQPFTTGMERADALDKLKRGIFPHGFPKLYPNVAVLILWMMNLDPQQRPSAEQLLEFESFTANQAQQQDLEIQTALQQLERENRELRQQLDQAEQAKEEMRQRLEAMQLKLDAYEAKDKQTKKKKEVRWVFS